MRYAGLLLITLFVYGMNSYAGGTEIGGGGKVIVCRDRDSKILSVETLDLWEAREILRLTIQPSKLNVRQQINHQIENLKNFLYYPLVADAKDSTGKDIQYVGAEALAYELTKTGLSFVNPTPEVTRLHGKTLTNIDDALEEAFPNGCAPEQAIIFRDHGPAGRTVLVNQDLIDQMDSQNQAALYLHEAVYRVLRQTDNERNSLRTRRAIGLSFTGHTYHQMKEFLPNEVIYCRRADADLKWSSLILTKATDNSQFYYFPLVLDGINLTDFNGSKPHSFGINAQSLDELIARLVVPDSNLRADHPVSFQMENSGKVIDQEVSARLEFSDPKSNGATFALAIVGAVSPWSLEPTSPRAYLTCSKVFRDDLFH